MNNLNNINKLLNQLDEEIEKIHELYLQNPNNTCNDYSEIMTAVNLIRSEIKELTDTFSEK